MVMIIFRVNHCLNFQILYYIKDPAGPYFENTPSVVRLDKTDAKFVDIIHTDTNKLVANNSFGINSPIGHVS